MLSLIPIFVYLLIVKLLDNFSLVRWKMLVRCGLCGALICALLLLIDAVAMLNDTPGELFPILEETLKGSIILLLISRHKILFFAEALCFGAAVGAGFALCENIAYAFYNTEMTSLLFAFRGFGTALLHMGCTAMMAALALSVNKYLAIISAIIIHYTYNLFLLPEFVQLLVTIIVFIVIFAIISYFDERRIYQWLDYSITDDVALLAAIREGKLTDTPTGEYLQKIKSHFPAEVFFDMICFMQLYLEIIIRGKSRMLLEEEGMSTPLTPEEEEKETSMKIELQTLQKNIGPMGIQLLRPILRYNIEDLKVLS